MRGLVAALLINGLTVCSVWAKDCNVSKQFVVNRAQVLAGVLEDSTGAALSNISLELVADGKIVKSVTTSNNGVYSFGEVTVGRYRIRTDPHLYCAPKVRCDGGTCSIEPKVQVDMSGAVVVF
jgi:hypothetical protein